MPVRRTFRKGLFFILGFAMVSLLLAGPPLVTDDPFSLPTHTGEFYLFATGTRAADGTALDAAPGVELNYSFLSGTFAHLVVPLAASDPQTGASTWGPGDIELGFKWRFLKQAGNRPSVATFPIVVTPTGSTSRGLGDGHTRVLLPVWLGEEWGAWTIYGGCGYWIHPGTGNRNSWFTGGVLQRQVNDRLYLCGEVYRQGADAVGGSADVSWNVGGGVALRDPWQIIFSAGRNIRYVADNRFSFYVALYRTF